MKTPPRFVIGDDAIHGRGGRIVQVTGRELHHMRDVLRLPVGADIVLVCTAGGEYPGRIIGYGTDAAIVRIAPALTQPATVLPRLILAAGILKTARMNMLVEKAAELNAAEFWPLTCARSVVREPSSGRRERWWRISLAAVKQSQRSATMEVHDAVDVMTMLKQIPHAAFRIVCLRGGAPLATVLQPLGDDLKAPPAIVLAVGPEGDFTDEEIAALRSAGFVAAALGQNRLRSETAALAALSVTAAFLAARQERKPG